MIDQAGTSSVSKSVRLNRSSQSEWGELGNSKNMVVGAQKPTRDQRDQLYSVLLCCDERTLLTIIAAAVYHTGKVTANRNRPLSLHTPKSVILGNLDLSSGTRLLPYQPPAVITALLALSSLKQGFASSRQCMFSF